jgi:energy-coupling factor transporter ATP-binding protein EcfA2
LVGAGQEVWDLYIERVRIKDIRGFTEVDLDLVRPGGSCAGWTVLAGRNGAGKSTFLKALALSASGPTAARSLVEGFSGWIRSGRKEGRIETLLRPGSPDQFGGGGRLPEKSFWTGLFLKDGNGGQEPALTEDLESNPKNRRRAPERGPWADNPSGWFLAGYGPYRRLTGHASDAQRLMVGPDRIARVVSLFREDASLLECVQWLREIYLRQLENKPGAAELLSQVIDLLNDGLMPDGVRVDRIDSEALWVDQHDALLPLSDLSDGYRTIAALVMDIVRHLHRAFGWLNLLTRPGENGPRVIIPHEGIVLIDEIDLHLHVRWQKQIGFWLKQHFPNIQFLVTTHSPFVCQAADRNGLIRLPAPGENRPAEHVSEDLYYTVINGSADDAVLTELFGLESPYSQESERLRQRVAELEARLQTRGASRQDRQALQELRAQLPQTPGIEVEQILRKLAIEA